MSVAIVDYGMGNLGSVLNMMRKIGADAAITSDPDEISRATKLILPGVGAFDAGMSHLKERGLIPVLERAVLEERKPILGICLGMELLARRSQEGGLEGLGWIAAEAIRFSFNGSTPLAVPHMGWNTLTRQRATPLLEGLESDARFYFAHSYYLQCDSDADVIGYTHYGHDFASAVQRDHIMGTQFHPEKSHKFGLRILQNFVSA